jgi:16S rRNA C967 or C1407 C5-methylase (RsmB/RsmF family)
MPPSRTNLESNWMTSSPSAELPPELVERVRASLSADQFDGWLAALPYGPGRVIRAHANGAIEELEAEVGPLPPLPESDASQIRAIPSDRLEAAKAWSGFQDGRAWMHTPGSVRVAPALAPKPGDRVLDLCAAPGSKAGHLAWFMQQQGELVVNELSRNRSQRLQRNLKLMNIEATVLTGPGESLGRRLGPTFDCVLVDVPCSGTGRVWHGDPRTWSEWSTRAAKRLAKLQRMLLHSGIAALKPGGTLVYSTCSLLKEENESVLEKIPNNVSVEWTKRFTPAPTDPVIEEGFFLARLRRG